MDLTPFGGVIRSIGPIYGGIALGATALALSIPSRRLTKLLMGLFAFAASDVPAVWWHNNSQAYRRGLAIGQARYRQALAKTEALFAERCKNGGEAIHKSIDYVDRAVWMRWRPPAPGRFEDLQFTLDDPYGRDCTWESCTLGVLRVTQHIERDPEGAKIHGGAYRFDETVDPTDGHPCRYTGAIEATHERAPEQIEVYKCNSNDIDAGPQVWRVGLERQRTDRFGTRYGMFWDDISTRENREHWIAGGVLRIIDLKTSEVIAELRYLEVTASRLIAMQRNIWTTPSLQMTAEAPLEVFDFKIKKGLILALQGSSKSAARS